jgi:RNA polymerase sigma-70 factor (sigma-E family)
MGALAREAGVRQDQAEFTRFYQLRRDACLRAVLATAGDRHTAEELVADAFAKAWASWRKVSRHPSPAAWVVRTALNTRISWWRRRRKEVALNAHDTTVMGPEAGIDAGLMAAVRRLPQRQREVVALRVFLDLDTETTARVLGIAPGTVTAHLARAIATLRGQFVLSPQREAKP